MLYNNASVAPLSLETNAEYRDTSSWYNIIVALDTTQATSSNRCKMYVNGVQVTSFLTATYPSQNDELQFNDAILHSTIHPSGSYSFDGYLAEVNFVDGQALTPAAFGSFNVETGVWQPEKYNGTYGTNGFYLDFRDPTSPNTLCYDKSGNGNNWTPNNISTTAGYTYDSMTDVPTLTNLTSSNYAVLNPLDSGGDTISNANLNLTASVGDRTTRATIAVATGKWYWEVTLVNAAAGNGSNRAAIGIATATKPLGSWLGGEASSWSMVTDTGNKATNGGGSPYATGSTAGDIIGVALDLDSGSLTYYKNGVSLGVAFSGLTLGTLYFPAISTAGYNAQAATNFGQRPFSYTPPTGFKSLNTFNLPDPVIKRPNQYMDATLWTGNGTSQSVVNAGGFAPDFVWARVRSQAYNHQLQDTVRGAAKYLSSNTTTAETTNSGTITAFNSNGFSVGFDAEVNQSAQTYVGWQWKKGATPGFDIVTYTGNGTSGRDIAHSLGIKPSMIITKARNDTTYHWHTWHTGIGADYYLALNTTSARDKSVNIFPYSGITSSSFRTSTAAIAYNNLNNVTYVAYLFAEIPGFSKFGSYTGNGSADGPFVYLGFRPKFVLIKNSSVSGDNWQIFDTARDTYNASKNLLQPNASNSESASGSNGFDITSNGIKVRDTGGYANRSNETYIYAAFAENPFKYALAR